MKRILLLVMSFTIMLSGSAFASHWEYAWNDNFTVACIDMDSIDVLENPSRVIYTERVEFSKDVSDVYIRSIEIPSTSKVKDFSYLLSKNEITIDGNNGYIRELENIYYNSDGTEIYDRIFNKDKETVKPNTYSNKIYKLVMDYVSTHQKEIIDK